MTEIILTDRYQAVGMPYPDPKTICKGQCEGMGVVPVHQDRCTPQYRELWEEAHAREHSWKFIFKVAFKLKWPQYLFRGRKCDGWHFVKCPDCGGTGKKK